MSNPKPEAEYVVGNPPFLGKGEPLRTALGDGYVDALARVYPEVGTSADFVLYWFSRSLERLQTAQVVRVGLISTNSIRQQFNRRVIETSIGENSVVYAIPDHPWIDAAEGAAVRISMVVLGRGKACGTLLTVVREYEGGVEGRLCEFETRTGHINADLTVGAAVSSAAVLRANDGLASVGMQLSSPGFLLDKQQVADLTAADETSRALIVEFANGRDLTDVSRGLSVIDAFGLSESQLRTEYAAAFQWLSNRVLPGRSVSRRDSHRDKWWVFAEPRSTFRPALQGIPRYIVTCRTAKHRVFTFVPSGLMVESTVVALALSDAYHLGVLSSHVHVRWAVAAGGTLEDRPRYQHGATFNPFPFPVATPAQEARIRELGEQLDTHRKRQQAAHPGLTLTGMYNVLEALREGRELSKKERTIHEQGLVSVLRQIHDDLDRAVLDAYGWPHDLDDEGILERLVALNAERAAEEAQGHIRWLRPDYQRPLWEARQKGGRRKGAATDEAGDNEAGDDEADEAGEAESAATLRPWPARMKDQIAAVREALATLGEDATPEAVAAMFEGVDVAVVGEVMEVVGG